MYQDGRGAVRGVSLAVGKGEFLALIGTSGAGKTTLLKLINRLVEPTRGTVRVDGADIAATDPVRLRRRIGHVFQGIGLFPHLTVAENIAVTLRLLGWPKPDIVARVSEMLDLVRLHGSLPRVCPRHYRAGRLSASGWRARWRRSPPLC